MRSITQELAFRQRMMEYLQHHGVIETANRFHVCRKTVWKYRKRWDGTPKSLADRSRRPHTFPRAQSEAEIALVRRMCKKYGSDLIQGYQQAKAKGYMRSYGCFKRTAGVRCRRQRRRGNERTSHTSALRTRAKKCKWTSNTCLPRVRWTDSNTTCTAQKTNAAVGHTEKCMPSTARIAPKTSCAAWSKTRHSLYGQFRRIMGWNLPRHYWQKTKKT